jgi:hypothetical protein
MPRRADRRSGVGFEATILEGKNGKGEKGERKERRERLRVVDPLCSAAARRSSHFPAPAFPFPLFPFSLSLWPSFRWASRKEARTVPGTVVPLRFPFGCDNQQLFDLSWFVLLLASLRLFGPAAVHSDISEDHSPAVSSLQPPPAVLHKDDKPTLAACDATKTRASSLLEYSERAGLRSTNVFGPLPNSCPTTSMR